MASLAREPARDPSYWPHYRRLRRLYRQQSARLNEVLYGMCREMPNHGDKRELWAKTWVIGRAYAAGLERHAADGLPSIIDALHRSRRWLDPALAALRKRDALVSHEMVDLVAGVHGRLLAALTPSMRRGNQPRSFVSKYLHFHAPCGPLYDRIASTRLASRGWYPWRRAWDETHRLPPGADMRYWGFCVRLAYMADDWRSAGLPPGARTMDFYLLSFPDPA